jgi:dephospho-CoA kinase
MKVIGVTGNFGTGKTTVCQVMAELGAIIINTDELGHELLQSDGQAYNELIAAFGDSILKKNKEIDRKKLAELAFQNSNTRARLNDIMHPKMYKIAQDRIEQYRRRGERVVVLEAALLLEAGWKPLVNQVWVTTVPEAVIVDRLKNQRGFNEEQILARLHTQMPSEEKIKYADVVINTDCSREDMKAKVTRLWQKLQPAIERS